MIFCLLIVLSVTAQQCPLCGEDAYEDVKTFIELQKNGSPRAGTLGNQVISSWIGSTLQDAGYDVELHNIPIVGFEYENCILIVNEVQVECFPLWFPNTDLVVNLPLVHNTNYTEPFVSIIDIADYSLSLTTETEIQTAISNGAKSVIILNHENPEIVALNDGRYHTQPWGIPVVICSGKSTGVLLASSTVDHLQVRGTIQDWQTFNIFSSSHLYKNEDAIVVTTPVSGWMKCGGERGPGISLFLGLAKWVKQQSCFVNVPFYFIGTAGHEIGYLGMEKNFEMLQNLGVNPQTTRAWLHLGASIATYNPRISDGDWVDNGISLSNCDFGRNDWDTIGRHMYTPFITEGYHPKPATESTGGELGDILKRGYPGFGLYGGFTKFHTRFDDQFSTSSELLDKPARALQTFFASLFNCTKPY